MNIKKLTHSRRINCKKSSKIPKCKASNQLTISWKSLSFKWVRTNSKKKKLLMNNFSQWSLNKSKMFRLKAKNETLSTKSQIFSFKTHLVELWMTGFQQLTWTMRFSSLMNPKRNNLKIHKNHSFKNCNRLQFNMKKERLWLRKRRLNARKQLKKKELP